MAFNAFGALAVQSASGIGIGAAQEAASCKRLNHELNEIITSYKTNIENLLSNTGNAQNSLVITKYLQKAKEDVKKLKGAYQKKRSQEVLDLEKTQIFMSFFLAVTIFIFGIKIYYSQRYKKQ